MEAVHIQVHPHSLGGRQRAEAPWLGTTVGRLGLLGRVVAAARRRRLVVPLLSTVERHGIQEDTP